MAGTKTVFNNQFAQASAEGNLAVPTDVTAVNVGDGIAMLVDQYGRPYIAPGSGGGSGGSSFITGESPPTAANSLVQLPTAPMPPAGWAQAFVGPAKVYRMWVTSIANERSFFQLYDLVGAPAGPPQISLPVPTISERKPAFFDLSPIGMYFATGVIVAISLAPGAFFVPPSPTSYYVSGAITL